MLRSVKEIIGYRIEAIDGELGKTRDVLFEDESWAVQYLVVDTGAWLNRHRVLISPQSVLEPDWSRSMVPVALNRQQVRESPDIESDLPISRAYERKLAAYYNWQPYWPMLTPMGSPIVAPPVVASVPTEPSPQEELPGNPNLRSVQDTLGYHIDAVDGEVGHVDDFLVQTDGWMIRYLVVEMRNLLPGRKVLVSPAWSARVDWQDRRVRVDLTCNAIRGSAAFDPSAPVNREYETRLYDYYGRPKYWERADSIPRKVG